jgi:glycosyltransferase involved in cell wall biosynthesis
VKILHVTKKYPHALGGDAVVVENLQKHQEESGHQVAILTSNCKDIKTGEHIYQFGLRDVAQALDHITPRRLISLFGLFFKAFYVLFKERPDVIHTHSIDMAFMVSFAARLFWIPMIHTFHIVTFYDQNQSFLRRKSEVLLAKASGLRLITAPNAHDVDALHEAGLLQSAVLPNGVDMDFWQPEKNASPAISDFTFVSVGRLEKQKGYDMLVRAAAELAQQSAPTFRIIIAGEGTQRHHLERLIEEYNLQMAIDLVGWKSANQVRQLLSRADAAIFSSHYETTPITLLEAWAMKVPVVTTSVGILRGLSKEANYVYLAKASDAASLAMAMRQCMSSAGERKKVALAGHKEAKKYTWPGITQTAETFYASIQ